MRDRTSELIDRREADEDRPRTDRQSSRILCRDIRERFQQALPYTQVQPPNPATPDPEPLASVRCCPIEGRLRRREEGWTLARLIATVACLMLSATACISPGQQSSSPERQRPAPGGERTGIADVQHRIAANLPTPAPRPSPELDENGCQKNVHLSVHAHPVDLDLRQLVPEADVIVRGRVTWISKDRPLSEVHDLSPCSAPNRWGLYRHAEILVREEYKGSVPSRLTVGHRSGFECCVDAPTPPSFEKGKEVALFLEQNPDYSFGPGTYTLVGSRQGKWVIGASSASQQGYRGASLSLEALEERIDALWDS